MSQPGAYSPQAVATPDILAAVYDCVAHYCLPALDPACIFRAGQNRASLPKNHNDYAVINEISDVRIGSNVTSFAFDPATEEDGVLTTARLGHVSMQIDFYGNEAKRRALALAILAHSPQGVAFFKPYGLSVLYADDPRDATGIDASDQFVPRWLTTLHLTAVSSLAHSVGWFDAVQLNQEVVS